MKKTIVLFLTLLFILCGCAQNNKQVQYSGTVGTFSYSEDCEYYKDDPGVKNDGFVNTNKTKIKTVEEAVELAKKECTVDYDTIDIDFDDDSKIYRISFYKEEWDGGNQDVYINQNGITQLIIYGE